MAHFYGTVTGRSSTPATRCGTKASGLSATASGWDIGGSVSVNYNKHLQTDVVSFYVDNGSNGSRSSFIVSFAKDSDGKLFIVNNEYPELFI